MAMGRITVVVITTIKCWMLTFILLLLVGVWATTRNDVAASKKKPDGCTSQAAELV
jgi:hypothetical protein